MIPQSQNHDGAVWREMDDWYDEAFNKALATRSSGKGDGHAQQKRTQVRPGR